MIDAGSDPSWGPGPMFVTDDVKAFHARDDAPLSWPSCRSGSRAAPSGLQGCRGGVPSTRWIRKEGEKKGGGRGVIGPVVDRAWLRRTIPAPCSPTCAATSTGARAATRTTPAPARRRVRRPRRAAGRARRPSRAAGIRCRSPRTSRATMAALGIGDDDVVVAYDDAGGVMAARLVWMLRATGHDAALLDGGLQAWDGPLETADAAAPAGALHRAAVAGRAAGEHRRRGRPPRTW